MKQRLVLILVIVFALFLSTGCTDNKKDIRIGVVNWPENLCMTNLVKIILEKDMNYQVDVVLLNIDDVFQSLAEGKCDLFLDAWLPITHEKFIYSFGSKIENIGINYKGARTGLVVPSYVKINSIAELNDHKNKFNGTIVGIEPSAGIIKSTQRVIAEYSLEYELATLNSGEMVEKLKNAIDKSEWIVVTGWSPHWKFAQWNLKFLDDPYFVYGAEENLHTIARKGFSKEYPQIASFFNSFSLNKEQLKELLLIEHREKKAENYIKWIQENRGIIDEWLLKKP